MLQSILQWFQEKPDPGFPALIIVGIGYNSHYVSGRLNREGKYRKVVAMIDDEPWNHRNQMNGAVIHYPSELLALVEKHQVCAVIQFEGEGVKFSDNDYIGLEKLNCPLFVVPAQISSVSEKLEYILELIRSLSPAYAKNE